MAALGLMAAFSQAPVAAASEPDYVPGEVLVRFAGQPVSSVVELPAGVGVAAAAQALDRNPAVATAVPDYIATAAAAFPNDTGRSGAAGGWRKMQWNFLPTCAALCATQDQPADTSRGGIDAPQAWKTLSNRGRGGAEGVRIAVLDTGVAFRSKEPKFRRSPDFSPKQFAGGYDFVSKSKLPLDRDGHGTHVTGTIAEQTNNKRGLTGLAYAAKIIPVRVLNAQGSGNAADIARGIRYAVKRHADVINLSLEFGAGVGDCSQVPDICDALKSATLKNNIVAVAASGNQGASSVKFPAAAPRVISVGATTKDACVADYSNFGGGLDLVAPGGGAPRNISSCDTDGSGFDISAPIFQLTFNGPGFKRFGYPSDFRGTSMATAHASGVAAMVIASRVVGKRPSRDAVECQLKATARHGDAQLGQPFDSDLFGAGLIDAGAAVNGRASGC